LRSSLAIDLASTAGLGSAGTFLYALLPTTKATRLSAKASVPALMSRLAADRAASR